MNPELVFEPYHTLIIFDEIQEYMNMTTSLKFFKQDGKYDVICSGSALEINNTSISSVSVGFKDGYIMHSMDFEEFLWANGYDDKLMDYLLRCMVLHLPLDEIYFSKMTELFKDFLVLCGYLKIVSNYVANNRNFSNCLKLKKNLYNDYIDDISKYLTGFDVSRAQKVFLSVTNQLAKGNHKFQFTKLGNE